ncbi:MAG TPA: phosphate acyltransferase PlsX [Candidatus Caenarcaniphilales bacterium]|nr:phosphate acyltransferase PlsX [Candidatus Caenarcaniphilales bacterium]
MDLETLARDKQIAASEAVRVAVDAMGGDHAPEEIVRGALDWAVSNPTVEILLVGDERRLRPFLDDPLPANVVLVQASESVAMEEQPALAVRRKRDASINVCMRLVREGRADAVVTAGHTGAGVASAIVHLGRLRGVDRPALAVQMVTDRGPFVLLDIGATTDSSGHNLAQYARMGAIFAERVLGVRDPSVALLSIGEEGGKGEQRVQDATTALMASNLRFLGNVEGKDLPHHPADIVVCDASVGNVTIKFFEGLSSFIFEQLRREFRRWPWGPVGYLFMRPGLGRIRRRFDYERLGGAPLLGVNGTVLITHGRARRRMVGFAVEVGAAAARGRIPERIAAALAADEEQLARAVADGVAG